MCPRVDTPLTLFLIFVSPYNGEMSLSVCLGVGRSSYWNLMSWSLYLPEPGVEVHIPEVRPAHPWLHKNCPVRYRRQPLRSGPDQAGVYYLRRTMVDIGLYLMIDKIVPKNNQFEVVGLYTRFRVGHGLCCRVYGYMERGSRWGSGNVRGLQPSVHGINGAACRKACRWQAAAQQTLEDPE